MTLDEYELTEIIGRSTSMKEILAELSARNISPGFHSCQAIERMLHQDLIKREIQPPPLFEAGQAAYLERQEREAKEKLS